MDKVYLSEKECSRKLLIRTVDFHWHQDIFGAMGENLGKARGSCGGVSRNPRERCKRVAEHMLPRE